METILAGFQTVWEGFREVKMCTFSKMTHAKEASFYSCNTGWYCLEGGRGSGGGAIPIPPSPVHLQKYVCRIVSPEVRAKIE